MKRLLTVLLFSLIFSAPAAAEALTCMTNGLWLSYLVSPKSWDRQVALDAIMSYLTNVFPKHYSNG